MTALLECRYYSVNCNGILEHWTLSIVESADGDYVMVKERSNGIKHEEYHLTYDDAEFDLECTHDKWIMNGAVLEGVEEFELPKFEEEL